VNVTVVGAGIVGCAVAYELVSRGARVRILDPRGTGQGATRASAGVLAPYIEGHAQALLRLTTCSLAQYDQFIDRLRADAHRDVEYRRIGTLQVALGADEAEQLADAARILASTDVDHHLLNHHEVRRLEPALTAAVTAALLIPQHAYVGVATMMAALEEALSAHRVSVEMVSVQRIHGAVSSVRIATSADVYDTDAVILAAGSWSGAIDMSPAIAPPVKPVRGQLVHLRFLEAPVAHIIWVLAATLSRGATEAFWSAPQRRTSDSTRMRPLQAFSCCSTAHASSYPPQHLRVSRPCVSDYGLRPLTSCRLSAHRPECAACITQLATTAPACCWRH
jgi:glycine oxidase